MSLTLRMYHIVASVTKLDTRPTLLGFSQTEALLAWSGSSLLPSFMLPIMKLSLVQARQAFMQLPEDRDGKLTF